MRHFARFLMLALLGAWSPSALSEVPHPVLVAVCNNDISALVAIQPRQQEMEKISWGRRKISPMDLAVSNGFALMINHFLNTGSKPTTRTFSMMCDQKQARTLCARFPRFDIHQTCKVSLDTDRWSRSCSPPDRYCKAILGE